MGQRHSSQSYNVNLSEHFLEDWAASKRIDMSFRAPFDSFDCRLLENQLSSPQVIARRLAKVTGDVIDVRTRAIAKILARPETSDEKTGRICTMTEAKKSKNPEAPKEPHNNPYQSVVMRLKPKMPSSLFEHKVYVPMPSAQLINKILNKFASDEKEAEGSCLSRNTTTTTTTVDSSALPPRETLTRQPTPTSEPSGIKILAVHKKKKNHHTIFSNDQDHHISSDSPLKISNLPQVLDVPDLLKR